MKIVKKEKKPRISVNKLAEYLEATPNRRKTIVQDAKYPKSFKVARYKEARDMMKAYISSVSDEDDVLACIDELRMKEPDSEFQENDINSSVEALESLLITDKSLFDNYDIDLHDEENELIDICGVDISVNPDLIISHDIENVEHIGALKLHISKTNPLSEENQNVVAMLLHQYAEKHLTHRGAISQKLCFSFDVFQQSIVCCPTAYKLRMKKIEAACEEIALWWDKL